MKRISGKNLGTFYDDGMRVSVVLPTYNESANVVEVLDRVVRALGAELLEVIVVDDNSPDGTADLVQGLGLERVRLIRRNHERGLASALVRGIREAHGEIVVWLDCDLGIPPESIPRLLEALEEHDIAVGSRYVEGGEDRRSPARALASRWMNAYANAILGLRVKDATSGFAAAKREVFARALFSPAGFGEYFPEFLYRARQETYSIVEVGYSFGYRKGGSSKLDANLWTFLRYGLQYSYKIARMRAIR